MKAIIPVAGVGSMLRPHTHTQPKPLVPVAGKPIIGHIIDLFTAGGITEFILIIGYLGDKIEQYIKEQYKDSPIKVSFVKQEPRLGSAHAVYMAKKFFEKEEEKALIVLGDTIVNLDLECFLQLPKSAVGVKRVQNPWKFGIAELNKDGLVSKLVEKPKIPKSNLAMVGIYKIDKVQVFFQGIQEMIEQEKTNNGEFQLTDALTTYIEKGEELLGYEVDNWFDCGQKDTLLEANAILLNRPNFLTSGNFNYPNTILIQPVKIGDNCLIENCIIGPNVAIGDNTSIKSSIVRNTIIGSFSSIDRVVLDASILGNDTSLKGPTQSLNIGDSTEINFG